MIHTAGPPAAAGRFQEYCLLDAYIHCEICRCCLSISSGLVSTQYLLPSVPVQLTCGRLPLSRAKSSEACERRSWVALCLLLRGICCDRSHAHIIVELSRGVVRVRNARSF
ncbi:unnamed protein product [Ectocarpus sp. 12 AP-2014]